MYLYGRLDITEKYANELNHEYCGVYCDCLKKKYVQHVDKKQNIT